jgi:hypothetical protein
MVSRSAVGSLVAFSQASVASVVMFSRATGFVRRDFAVHGAFVRRIFPGRDGFDRQVFAGIGGFIRRVVANVRGFVCHVFAVVGGGGGGGGAMSSNPLVGQRTAFIPGTTLEFFYTFTADLQWKFSERDLATGSFENVEGTYTLILPTADAPGEIVMDGTFGGAFFDDQVFIMANGQIVFMDSLFGTINLMRH